MSERVALDPAARRYDGGRTLLGGDPMRVLRFTAAGARELDSLAGGARPVSDAARTLTRRLLEAGLAHPRPAPAPTDAVTVVVPVRDRPAALGRCLRSMRAETPGRILVVDDGSRDAEAVVAVCDAHDAELIRRERAGGPGAARNAGVAQVSGGLVAFLDSDCVGEPGWLALLCGAMATDAGLGAVAPRIRPRSPDTAHGEIDHDDALSRYAATRSPLDLGAHPARVRPGGRVAYLPTAALLVRHTALGTGFDEALRHGEDVDLLWRMHDAGWSLRYEPSAVVGHQEPATRRAWLARRYRYGTAAGPLARRHPDRLAPVRVHPRPAAMLGLAAAGRPRSAAIVLGVHVALGTRSLRRHGVPGRAAVGLCLRGVVDSTVAVGRTATMLAPGALMLGLIHRRSRATAVTLILAEPLRARRRSRRSRRTEDLLSFVAFALADDVAYGAGVWAGALRARTAQPLRPTAA